jgi:circadian clock protein KaiC
VISGAPGTAKTTLAASFVRAAAARGERALYVAFDESYGQIVLDMQSLGLSLDDPELEGRVHGLSLSALGVTAEEHYISIRRELERVRPDVLVIDPVSALFKGYESARARGVAERLVDMLKSTGITTVLTSLVEPESDFSASSISTLADAWLSLNYTVVNNVRGRALSIIKARGTQHSHEIFELHLSRNGVAVSRMPATTSQAALSQDLAAR